MLRVRFVESALPAGSRDKSILLAWILDSMALIRSRGDGNSIADEQGGMHSIVSKCFMSDPRKGWTSAEIAEVTGISSTGIHHQLVKIRESGLVSDVRGGDGKKYMLRGGSFSTAIELISVNATTIAKQRLSPLYDGVVNSPSRMMVSAEEESLPFKIDIIELGPSSEKDVFEELVTDLGFGGDRPRANDSLHSDVMSILVSSDRPVELTLLMERSGGSRARVSRILERMRSAGMVERAVVEARIPIDVFGSLTRQYRARGSDWLVGRGGLGRLPNDICKSLINSLEKEVLTIEEVSNSLEGIPLLDQRVLLNTIGGRAPLGYRLTGATGEEVVASVLRGLERTLSRISSVAGRLDSLLE